MKVVSGRRTSEDAQKILDKIVPYVVETRDEGDIIYAKTISAKNGVRLRSIRRERQGTKEAVEEFKKKIAKKGKG